MTVVPPPPEWQSTPARPPVVIAIANWNRVDLLRQCLESVRASTEYPHYRIAVFDQASSDGSVEFLRSLDPEVDVVCSPRNVGFTLGTNALIDRYPAWDVVLLNNDTRVTAGWLTSLVETATRSDAIGMVGAKLVLADGTLQEAGGEVFADGRVRARGRSESAAYPRYQERRDVDYCSAACLYVKRTVLDRCGPLERLYEAGYYEDVDLAFKARAAGFRVLYEPRCVVIHREHGSFGADVAGTLMRRHREIFRSRWINRLVSQPASPFELVHAAGRPHLLLLTELVPLNTLSPRMRRVRQLLRALNGPFAVAYLNAASHGVDRYAAVVEELGATPFFPSMKGAPGLVGLDEEELVRINYFPLAVCGSPDAEAFLRGRFPPVLFDATTVIVDVAMEADVAAASLRTAANDFVVMSDAQRQVLLGARPDARCALLPLDVEATTSQPLSRDGRSDVVILSDNLDGPTAAAAVAQMLRDIVPDLQRTLGDAPIRFNGGPLAAELIAAMPAGVELLPTSMPIGTALDRARVVVVPHHWCPPDTVSNVAEARARGIPVVATSGVVRGAGLSSGIDAVIADTADAFVELVGRVYCDPWYWAALAGAPRVPLQEADPLGRSLSTWAAGNATTGFFQS
jgi:GT2 family glycosyltransferase